jgi:hypothetical protein
MKNSEFSLDCPKTGLMWVAFSWPYELRINRALARL